MAFHQYNKFQYNTAQYNSDTRFLTQLCAESISSADARIGNPVKVLADTITSTDSTVTKSGTRAFSESLLATDTVAKSVQNKGLAEAVRVNDWLQVDRKKDRSPWSN